MTDAEKRARGLIEHLSATWLPRAADLRDLSRPVRKRSHYPTGIALLNALQKLIQVNQDTDVLLEYLGLELEEIREHARRERINRQ
jgi:hypothetical protein